MRGDVHVICWDQLPIAMHFHCEIKNLFSFLQVWKTGLVIKMMLLAWISLGKSKVVLLRVKGMSSPVLSIWCSVDWFEFSVSYASMDLSIVYCGSSTTNLKDFLIRSCHVHAENYVKLEFFFKTIEIWLKPIIPKVAKEHANFNRLHQFNSYSQQLDCGAMFDALIRIALRWINCFRENGMISHARYVV